ncbi:photosynthetic reaction center cytochrome PufC [Piscinibacter sakaiensis]|uniref:Photosynthetic reaction center cytochrome c subunit n=1 Tax=Piscinibacter sakaiensis TaxID=1547922 RepID=A0A0K8NVW1_PISS1|nr:photosynthetic reaction center cytochrome PufC [Piscinibacter sakaiensis]GAP34419.1 photosynthetic reaction center cytochrome c subunit [Piscinibacter sakaiensis]
MSARMLAAALTAVLLLAGCERPPMETVQRGYRGTGMEEVINPRLKAAALPKHAVPEALPAAPGDGPKASQVMQNVKVLGDLSVAEFTRTMLAITAWVAPNEGCAYCHNLQNLADDSKYQKVVARRMLEMNRQVNSGWTQHVAGTGVTCWTCHRGQHVPEPVWFKDASKTGSFAGNLAGQNAPAKSVAYASLPNEPFSALLLDKASIRVNATAALPGPQHGASIASTEKTYGLMMHFSQSLGVNCTYCHNSQNFGSWQGSSPQRVKAWHGIQMVRSLNNEYLVPLTNQFPAARLGPGGDVAKVNCSTCHQGVFKPLYGAPMAQSYPALSPSAP